MEQIQENQEIKEKLVDITNLSSGLEILVQLAEKGDIDPWDIDLIDVTDKYLAALDKTPRENLLNAGRAIFYSSVLLRLKSDILLNISNETLLNSQHNENFFPEDDLLLNEEGVPLDLTKLESYIVRSSLGKQQRKRKVTLNDLIFALQQAEEEEERRAIRLKLRQERRFTIAMPETPDDVLDIAQDEEVEDIAEKIDAIIQEHLTDEKPITYSFLHNIVGSKAKTFLAILFLTHAKKIVLDQKDFYEEIYIYKALNIIEDKDIPSKAKANEIVEKKRNIVQKVKDKLKDLSKGFGKGRPQKNKTIEITTDGDEVIEINTKTE
jgi:segregation and condensation protein A